MSGHNGHQSDALAFTQLSSAVPLWRKALENRRAGREAGERRPWSGLLLSQKFCLPRSFPVPYQSSRQRLPRASFSGCR